MLRALGSRLPDYRAPTDELGQTHIALTPSAPLAGQQVVARVEVQEASTTSSPPTTVRLVATPANGGSPLTLAEVPLAALAGGTSTYVAMPFTTAGLSGDYRLAATCDPDHRVPEILETNNVTTGELHVVNTVDSAIPSSDIHFADGGAGSVRVDATVHALGQAVTTPFDVAFYMGSPGSGGALLGRVALASVAAGGSTIASVTWDTSHVGGPTSVYAVVDPGHAVTEATTADNQAFRIYFPGLEKQVSLAVYDTDIVQTPRPAFPGDTVGIDVPVHNLASNDAQRVQVALETPAGMPYSELELDRIPAGGVVHAHFSLPLENRTDVVAVVDPDGLQNDATRSDNRAAYSLLVSDQAHPIDVRVQTLLFASGVFQTPQTVTVYADEAGTSAVDTSVALFRGDPVFGGAQELARQPVHIKGIKSGVAGSVRLSFPGIVLSDGETLTACVDPDHTLADAFPDDNCMSVTGSTGRSDVAIDTRGIQINPVGPDVGEPMTVTAAVRELSGHDASGVARVWQGRPGFEGSRILGQRKFHVPGGGKTTLSWRLLRPKGDSNLWVALTDVNPVDAGEYQDLGSNNFAVRNVYLKALIDTGRRFGPSRLIWATGPVVGDIQGTGRPAVVFGEHADDGVHVTAMSLSKDGTQTELWSTIVGPATYSVRTPVLADLTGDGHPDVLVATAGVGGTSATDSRARTPRWYRDGPVAAFAHDGQRRRAGCQAPSWDCRRER